jgi:methyl-accepting chemotaxis protein
VPEIDTPHVVPKAHLTGLVVKCGLLFASGLLLTGVILFLSTHQPLGPSYQECFARLSQLKNEILVKSILIFCILMALILCGVIFFTVIYTHRVVGPIVRLRQIIKCLAAGDFTHTANLRTKDAIQPMAESLNLMIGAYKEKISALQNHTQEMRRLINQPATPDLPVTLRQQIKAIDTIISSLNL